jgi:hypothetical protein
MNISECFEKYKEITLQLIDKCSNGDDLDELLNERGNIIDKIGEINLSKEELKEKVEALNILELDNELQTRIKQEKNKTKSQIDILRKNREARKNYNNIQERLQIFSAKG